MKKALFILAFVVFCSVAQAQCVGTITDVKQDPDMGSIIVVTEYTLNGKVVQIGQTRYNENSGTNAEIIAKAKEDIAIHCENIIRRIEANRLFRHTEALKIQKALTQPIIDDIKDDLVGYSTQKTEAVEEFKGNQIKVTADEKNTVTSIEPVVNK